MKLKSKIGLVLLLSAASINLAFASKNVDSKFSLVFHDSQPTKKNERIAADKKNSKPNDLKKGNSVPKTTLNKQAENKKHNKYKAYSEKASYGAMAGLGSTADALGLSANAAYVLDQDTQEVLFSKNPSAVLPIASITKLMTAMVILDAQLPLSQLISINQDDIDTEKWSRSRLKVGAILPRAELLQLALMSSENRAAHALARSYPTGITSFIERMNKKAKQLGMRDTLFVDPTGLSSQNKSSVKDLSLLTQAGANYHLIKAYSTLTERKMAVGNTELQYNTTNRLLLNPEWDIRLQKTGYISEAGRCLTMLATVGGRRLVMVFLDATGHYSHWGDAERVKRWLEGQTPVATPEILKVSKSTPLPAAGG